MKHIHFQASLLSTPVPVSYTSLFQAKLSHTYLLVYEKMRDRMERFVVLPFSIGCASQSSVAVAADVQPKKNKAQLKSDASRRQEKDESSSGLKVKNPGNSPALPKPNTSSNGIIHRLMRSLRSFSRLFVYEEEIEEEMEMEIGFPTDVKHITHIGWDGSTTTNPVKGWENLMAPEILAFPDISFRKFELAMAAQADAPPGVNSSSFS